MALVGLPAGCYQPLAPPAWADTAVAPHASLSSPSSSVLLMSPSSVSASQSIAANDDNRPPPAAELALVLPDAKSLAERAERPQCANKAFTSVPVARPGDGCTTMPAGCTGQLQHTTAGQCMLLQRLPQQQQDRQPALLPDRALVHIMLAWLSNAPWKYQTFTVRVVTVTNSPYYKCYRLMRLFYSLQNPNAPVVQNRCASGILQLGFDAIGVLSTQYLQFTLLITMI
eukprot:GHRR01018911.1.p1 GENE.GHRR01018911.1~~GHRR01018911.1.p1  ORF type:complete len:228 (+),score=66.04 GHRR01018911.1:1280-1963(+)